MEAALSGGGLVGEIHRVAVDVVIHQVLHVDHLARGLEHHLAVGFGGGGPVHQPAPRSRAPGATAIDALEDGSAQVAQSAPSQAISALERGQTPPALHFAQINEMDGFFLTGRAPDPAFTWAKLAGKKVMVDHRVQPLAMFKYSRPKAGLD